MPSPNASSPMLSSPTVVAGTPTASPQVVVSEVAPDAVSQHTVENDTNNATNTSNSSHTGNDTAGTATASQQSSAMHSVSVRSNAQNNEDGTLAIATINDMHTSRVNAQGEASWSPGSADTKVSGAGESERDRRETLGRSSGGEAQSPGAAVASIDTDVSAQVKTEAETKSKADANGDITTRGTAKSSKDAERVRTEIVEAGNVDVNNNTIDETVAPLQKESDMEHAQSRVSTVTGPNSESKTSSSQSSTNIVVDSNLVQLEMATNHMKVIGRHHSHHS